MQTRHFHLHAKLRMCTGAPWGGVTSSVCPRRSSETLEPLRCDTVGAISSRVIQRG